MTYANFLARDCAFAHFITSYIRHAKGQVVDITPKDLSATV